LDILLEVCIIPNYKLVNRSQNMNTLHSGCPIGWAVTLTINTDNESQARTILSLLTEAEENGDLDFAFNCRIGQITERVEFDNAL